MTTTSRRAMITGATAALATVASVATIAATPASDKLNVASVASTPAVTATLDAKAALARFEIIVDKLRNCTVAEGWSMDEEAAAAAMDYFQRMARGEPEDDDAFSRAIDFICSHGQSLDWIFRDNPGVMICVMAAHSERAFGAAADNDPIFEVMRLFKQADDRLEVVLKLKSDRDRTFHKRHGRFPQVEKFKRQIDAAHTAFDEARMQFCATVPTTLAGLKAKLAFFRNATGYISECMDCEAEATDAYNRSIERAVCRLAGELGA